MSYDSSRKKWVVITVTLLAAALALILITSRGPRHPEFGRIYQTHFNETPKGLEKITRGPLHSLFNDTAGCMRLGSTMLFWNLASNASFPKTGYLYFGDRPLHKWEFAPCRHTRLGDVTGQDLDCQFYGSQHPRGKAAFGASWRTNALYVAEGQVFFARSVSYPSVIYV